LAAAVIARDDPDAIMASFAADHLIADPAAFAATVLAAVEGARAGHLMTIGITPTGPETGFGYLRCSAPPAPGTAQRILEFKEKPSAEVAAEYVASGEYLWNASMFVWQVSTFLDALAEHRPDVLEPVRRIVAARDTDDEEQVLAEVWPTIPKVAVDYAVMEPAAAQGRVATVPGDFGWSDIGDFDTLGALLAKTCDGAAVVGAGEVVCLDAENSVVVPHGGRLVALLGVRDLIVVDTPDALLVGHRARTQDVKRVTELLKERGLTDFL
jgi:mannose-1-phosphate guanylyltransferase